MLSFQFLCLNFFGFFLENSDIFAGFGILAPLAYVAFVIAEVVIAPLPGLMLYAPGGILFGPLLGGLLALIGNTIGAGIACSLVRSVGDQWLTRFFERDKLERVQQKAEHRGPLLIFLLRINPLTSSDVVSYAAGLTRIPTWRVMFATASGMIPMCFGQAWLASSFLTAFPHLFYPFLTLVGLYFVVALWTLRKLVAGSKNQ